MQTQKIECTECNQQFKNKCGLANHLRGKAHQKVINEKNEKIKISENLKIEKIFSEVFELLPNDDYEQKEDCYDYQPLIENEIIAEQLTAKIINQVYEMQEEDFEQEEFDEYIDGDEDCIDVYDEEGAIFTIKEIGPAINKKEIKQKSKKQSNKKQQEEFTQSIEEFHADVQHYDMKTISRKEYERLYQKYLLLLATIQPQKELQQSRKFEWSQGIKFDMYLRKDLEQELYDFDVINKQIIQLTTDYQYSLANFTLKQYENNYDINNRIKKISDVKFIKEVNINEYQFEDAYLGTRLEQLGLVAKLQCEKNIKFIYPENLTFAYYDIETFNADNSQQKAVNREDKNCKIATISLVYEQNDIMYLKLYAYNINNMQYDTDKMRSLIMEHDKNRANKYVVDLYQFQSQSEMCIQFFNDLNSIDKIVIANGFNSNHGENPFDLPFLMTKSKLVNIQQSTIYVKERMGYRKQIKKLSITPNVYYLDAIVLFYDCLLPEQKKNMPNFKLDTYLSMFGIPNKLCSGIDNIYKHIQKQMLTPGSDNTYVGAYNLYDSLCLLRAYQMKQIPNTLKQKVEMYEIPLSIALYKFGAPTFKLVQKRLMYQEGIAFSFSDIMTDQKIPYKGATTIPALLEDMYKVHKYVANGDFESLYPSVIMQNNIAIDTLVKEQDLHLYDIEKDLNKIDIAYVTRVRNLDEKHEPQYVYFMKEHLKQSPLVKRVAQTFGRRKEFKALASKAAKELKNDPDNLELQSQYTYYFLTQYLLKIEINTIYGMLGNITNSLYQYESAAAVTAGARLAIDTAYFELEKVLNEYNAEQQNEEIKNRPCFIDTDSVFMILNKQTYSQIQEVMNKVTQNIKNVLGNKLNFQYESENAGRYIFPSNKKSYAKITEDDHFEIKGVTWNNVSKQLQGFIEALIRKLMKQECKSRQETMSAIYDFINDSYEELQYGISSKNNDIILKYAFQQKSDKYKDKNGKLTQAGYLYNNYGEGPWWCVYYNAGQKQNQFNVIPVNKIEDYSLIQTNRCILKAMQPITTFFQNDLKHIKQEQCEQTSKITFRVDPDREFQNKQPQKLVELILRNGENKSYHEKIIFGQTKCFFDIELPSNIKKHTIDLARVIQYLKDIAESNTIHIAKSTGDKQSYHIVIDIITSLYENKLMAQQLNSRYGLDIADLQVYRLGGTLRLPMCCKYDTQNKKINRQFNIVTASSIQDFFITDVQNVQYNIAVQNTCPISDMVETQYNYSDIENKIYKQFNLETTVSGNSVAVHVHPYKCPACSEQHDSNNLGLYNDYIFCYKSKQRIQLQDIIEEEQNSSEQLIIQNARVQNKQFVQYDINQYKHTFVKSQLGTGKTQQLQKILEQNPDQYQCIVVLSFRKTFTKDFTRKFGFENYLDIPEHQISLKDHKRLIIQTDSLMRISYNQKIDLLVIDELESVISQLNSFNKKENRFIKRLLFEFLSEANKCLYLDGLMQQDSVLTIMNVLNEQNYTVLQNIYKNKTDYEHIIYQRSNSNKAKQLFTNHIVNELEQGKNIVAMVTSNNLAQTLYECTKNDYKVVIYTGTDLKVNENKISMAKQKDQDFNNVNEVWTNYNLVIYTSTLTAGVSFDQEHFHKQINYFSTNTCDAIQFTQGIHRVRHLHDKMIITYLAEQNIVKHTTPLAITKKELRVFNQYIKKNILQQFDVWMEARENSLMVYRSQLVQLWTEQMGYKLTTKILDETNVQALKLEKQVVNIAIKLTEEDLKLPKQIKRQDFAQQVEDPEIYSKVQLVKLMDVYKVDSVEKFNEIPEDRKKEMFKHKEERKMQNIIQTIEQQDMQPELIEPLESEQKEQSKPEPQSEPEQEKKMPRQDLSISLCTEKINNLKDQYLKNYKLQNLALKLRSSYTSAYVDQTIFNMIQGYMIIRELKHEINPEQLQQVFKRQFVKVVNEKINMLGYKLIQTRNRVKIDGKWSHTSNYSLEQIDFSF